MSDTYFLQFYKKVRPGTSDGGYVFANPRDTFFYALHNSYSDTLDLCKKHGEMIWFEEESNPYTLPIEKGTLYISAVLYQHMDIISCWIDEFPDIDFVVGGPGVIRDGVVLDKKPNVIWTTKSVEQYFNEPDFSYKWKLELPDIKEKDAELSFGYTLDTNCYWGKCIFCNCYTRTPRTRQNIDNDLPFTKIGYGKKIIKLIAPSMKPEVMKKFIPKLPRADDISYHIDFRSCPNETETLMNLFKEYGDDLPNLRCALGVEFPSEKIKTWFNKGWDSNSIKILTQELPKFKNIKVTVQLILGLPNLDENDLNELRSFITSINENCYVYIRRLWLRHGTKIYDLYGVTKNCFAPLTEKQKYMNLRALQIAKEFKGKVFDFTKSFKD